jgi:hypothetical protein
LSLLSLTALSLLALPLPLTLTLSLAVLLFALALLRPTVVFFVRHGLDLLCCCSVVPAAKPVPWSSSREAHFDEQPEGSEKSAH